MITGEKGALVVVYSLCCLGALDLRNKPFAQRPQQVATFSVLLKSFKLLAPFSAAFRMSLSVTELQMHTYMANHLDYVTQVI